MNGNAPILNASVSRATEDAAQLEREIAHQLAEVDWFYTASKRYEKDGYASLAKDYRHMAAQAARNAAALVAQRTPETVARMEKERGLV